MTEEQFLAEFVALRDQLPRGSKLIHRGWMAWRFGDTDGTVYVRRNGTLTQDKFVTDETGRRFVFDEAGQRRVVRGVPVTSDATRDKVMQLLRGELKYRRDAIARGVATRARRRKAQLKKVTDVWLRGDGSIYANRNTCVCCEKLLTDPESRARGIGPECWEQIVQMIEAARAEQHEAA